jgi:hypothetical protein
MNLRSIRVRLLGTTTLLSIGFATYLQDLMHFFKLCHGGVR